MAYLFSTFLDKHPLNPKWLRVVSYNTYRIYLHITRQVWEWEKMQPRPKRRIQQNTQTWGRHVQSHGIWKTTLFNVVEPIPTLNQRNIMSMPLFHSSTFSVMPTKIQDIFTCILGIRKGTVQCYTCLIKLHESRTMSIFSKITCTFFFFFHGSSISLLLGMLH